MRSKLKVAGFVLLSTIILVPLLYGIAAEKIGRNLHLQQAEAFLKGRLEIPRYSLDLAVYEGKFYVPFPPVPAILLMPFVAAFGIEGTRVTILAIALTVLSVHVLSSILKKLQLGAPYVPWVLTAFFLGTGYWLCVRWSSGVWYYAHVVAVMFMLLAINESLGKGRGMLVGAFLGCAFLSRQLCLYSLVFLCVALWENKELVTSRKRTLSVASCLGVTGVFLAAYLLYNQARFGSPFDTGYSHLMLSGFMKERVARLGLFHPAYFPSNFVHLFLQGFHVEFCPPSYVSIKGMDWFGTSVTFASPFVFFAFYAKWKRRLLWAAWASIFVTVAHLLFYYNNGWVQVNSQRYVLDFLPVLIILVALGAQNCSLKLFKASVTYSLLLNIVALVCIPVAALLMK